MEVAILQLHFQYEITTTLEFSEQLQALALFLCPQLLEM